MSAKSEMFAALQAKLADYPLLDHVHVEYSGSGDSGGIDTIDYYAETQEIGIEDRALNELIEAYVYEALSRNAGGWEINDGAQGNVTIWVKKEQPIEFDHSFNEIISEEAPFEESCDD